MAPPLVFLVCWLLSASTFGAFLERTFAGMWLHELGHASASWFTGFSAVPLPWVTYWAEERSWVVTLVMLGALGYGCTWGLRHRRKAVTALCGLGIMVSLVGRFALTTGSARQFAIFFGDAGAMFYGALMASTFFARRTSQLVVGWLRWGFLVWGACAFCDATRVWWECKKDFAAIPFGLEDGAPSDATQLVDTYRWSEGAMIQRYLVFAACCGIALFAAWVFSLWQQRRLIERVALGQETDDE